MVFLTESMLGIPSPPAVRPLEPSACIVKWVRGARRVSVPWAVAEPAPVRVAAARARTAAPAVTAVRRNRVAPWPPLLLWTGLAMGARSWWWAGEGDSTG